MIAVITDSTCDLPESVVAEAGIQVLPSILNIGQRSYRDGIDISRSDFYEMLPALAEFPKTASLAPGEFLAAYESALSRADYVISIHVAANLSGIYNAARLAAQQIAPARIYVIDSKQTSMGLGWGVLAAVDAIRSGATVQAVLNSVADILRRVRLYALLATMDYLAKSGRVNVVQAGLGGLLSIKPLVELRDGTITTLARTRTWSRAVDDLIERAARLAPFERLAVMHSNYAEGAQEFLAQLCKLIACPPNPIVTDVTPIIGIHVGPHAIGIAVVQSKSQ